MFRRGDEVNNIPWDQTFVCKVCTTSTLECSGFVWPWDEKDKFRSEFSVLRHSSRNWFIVMNLESPESLLQFVKSLPSSLKLLQWWREIGRWCIHELLLRNVWNKSLTCCTDLLFLVGTDIFIMIRSVEPCVITKKKKKKLDLFVKMLLQSKYECFCCCLISWFLVPLIVQPPSSSCQLSLYVATRCQKNANNST